MKLTIDPMPVLRDHAAYRVNQHFNVLASDNLHREQAHAHKRGEAAAIIAGAAPSAEFQAEAELRGITAAELAMLVLAKPNDAAQRELRRQRLLRRIAAIARPAELELLVSDIAGAIRTMEQS